MAYSRMGDLSDFYIYKSLLGGFDCYVGKEDEQSSYFNFETIEEVLKFVETRVNEGYKILPSTLERLKTELRG